MRWDAGHAGGFTSGDPWLPMGGDIAERNVDRLRADERSLLWLYRRLIQVRRQEPALTAGDYMPMRSHHDILMYRRVWRDDTIIVALNTVHQPRRLENQGKGTLLLSTYLDSDRTDVTGSRLLRASEGIIMKVSPS